MKLLLPILLIISFLKISQAQNKFDRDQYIQSIKQFERTISYEFLDSCYRDIKQYHPYALDTIIGVPFKEYIRSFDIPSEPINTVKFVNLTRKIFDFITTEDPHFVILNAFFNKGEFKLKDTKIPPFDGLCIHDTLIIEKSYNQLLKKGDRIITINNIAVREIFNNSYRYKYIHMGQFMFGYNYELSSNYKITFEREKKRETIEVSGISSSDYGSLNQANLNYKILESENIGYFKIHTFRDNKNIWKSLRIFCSDLENKEINDLVIDLRSNPGGTGYMLDALFSLFSAKKEINYQKNAFAKVSPATIANYKFAKTDLGKVKLLPEKYQNRKIKLKPKYHFKNINLYVLISNYTASTAATFANVIQYNNMGTLVGESLAHNAQKYGEVIPVNLKLGTAYVTTVLFDEYTKREDKRIVPDIEIPYVAKEFMEGGDPMLEKLITKIKEKR